MQPPEVRPDPGGAAAHADAADHLRRRSGDDAGLAAILAIPHRAGLLGQAGALPIVDPRAPGDRDLAIGILAGDPERVLRVQLHAFRIEHVDDRVPAAPCRMLPAQLDQRLEIVAQPQPQPHPPRRLVALQHKAGEQPRRAVLDRQSIGKAEIVLRDNVRIDRNHRPTPQRTVC